MLIILSMNYLALSQSDSSVVKNVTVMPKNSFYVEPGTYGTRRESDPPDYVVQMNNSNISGTSKLDWLELGLDYRARPEIRNNDIRRPDLTTDFPVLLRSRVYVGIKSIIDPFRFVVELEDAHRVNSQFGKDTRDFNRAELIQLYGALHFENLLKKDNLGNSRPIYLRFGRQTFEFLDRRLIALNRWRNTTNNFVGFRGTIGQDKNDWQLNLLAMRPIERKVDQFDHRDTTKYFYAVIGHWRRWSKIATIEPFYMGLTQTPSAINNNQSRQIHSPGIRLYGWLFGGKFNYDITHTQQFGTSNGLKHQAFMSTAEIGVKMKNMIWKPRISLFYGFVSGDKDPNDQTNNRFERFYGFARPWSPDDYIIPENVSAPKLRIEIQPTKNIKADFGYGFYWLASATDRFANLLDGTNNRDITGQSGNFLGHGFDFRIIFSQIKTVQATLGYANYQNGDFVLNRQNAALGKSIKSSNFLYLEVSFNLIEFFALVNPHK